MADVPKTKADYSIEALAEGVYAIDTGEDESLYLVCGSEKAFLIDTGSSLRPLLPVIRGLYDGPVELILTHAHYDHMYHANDFDTVYLHAADLAAWKTLAPLVQVGSLTAGKKPRHFRVQRFCPLSGGEVLDAGGKTLRVIPARGHTPGSIILADDKDRILFTGDAFGSGDYAWMWMPGCSVLSDYAASLKEILTALTPCKDYTMTGGHRRQATEAPERPHAHQLSLETAEDMLILCGKILSGECRPERTERFLVFKLDTYWYGKAGIVLNKSKIK